MPAFPRAGERNRQIRIDVPVQLQDPDTGNLIDDWEPLGTGKFWAACEPGRGREFYASAGILAESPMLFRINYREGVTPLARVWYRNEIYTVDSVQDYRDARTEIHIYARAGVNKG